MITKDQFNKLTEFQVSSWAIWDEKKLSNKYFSDNLHNLNNNVIVLNLK